VGNDCGRALVARAVDRVRPLVKARTRWARTRANGRGRVGPGADWWERARTLGADAWDRARTLGADAWTGRGFFARPRMRAHTRRARTGRKGRGLQARTRGTGRGLWAHTRRAQTQVNGAQAGRAGREHNILARTEGDSHAAIAMETRVWAQTGARTGAGPNGRVLQWGRVHAGAEGAHAATVAGDINYPSNNIFFANLFSRSAPCPSTPSTLCKELWCGRLALKLVRGGGGFLFLLYFR
jgi:hypothetical protein